MKELINVENIFAENVFTMGKMKARLPKSAYKEVVRVMEQGGELSLATADIIAKAMKDWAVEKGATHYSHWFQPLTGITAEKHDSFITHPDEDGKMINESGSSIPYKFVVEKINDEFEVIDSRIPRDGSYYPKDIKNIFPRNVRKQIEDVHQDGTVKRLSLENQQKAEFYFTK